MRVKFRTFSCFLTRICCQRNRSNKTSYASCSLEAIEMLPSHSRAVVLLRALLEPEFAHERGMEKQ